MAILALNTAATGLSALETALDVIANNLANVNTTGFKASRVNFQDLLYSEEKYPGIENANGDRRPIGLYVGLGVSVSGTQLDISQGVAEETGRSLDLLIDGEGLFQVEIEDDIGDGIGYTRAGNFTLNQDGEIVLASDTGRRLIPNIIVPEDAIQIEVSTDGVVSVEIAGETEPQVIETIQLATFINPQGLKQIGENLYIPTAASGDPSEGDEAGIPRGLQRRAGDRAGEPHPHAACLRVQQPGAPGRGRGPSVDREPETVLSTKP
ncbi:MAG: flagellar hook-basal body complex protein [Planctomycetota bacterium]|jgi:flagellar basal-body rod protein FlgG